LMKCSSKRVRKQTRNEQRCWTMEKREQNTRRLVNVNAIDKNEKIWMTDAEWQTMISESEMREKDNSNWSFRMGLATEEWLENPPSVPSFSVIYLSRSVLYHSHFSFRRHHLTSHRSHTRSLTRVRPHRQLIIYRSSRLVNPKHFRFRLQM